LTDSIFESLQEGIERIAGETLPQNEMTYLISLQSRQSFHRSTVTFLRPPRNRFQQITEKFIFQQSQCGRVTKTGDAQKRVLVQWEIFMKFKGRL